MQSPTGYPPQQYLSQQYPPQQYSSSQSSPTSSRRSTLATTPTYGHASLPPHPPAPPHLSGSAPYNPPPFPVPAPAVPVRYPSSNPSGPPPLEPPHRSATMPMPVPIYAASSVPYDMQTPNTMHSSSQLGTVGGPQPTVQGRSYRHGASTAVEFPTVHVYNKRLTAGVHERNDDPRNFRDEDLEQSREDTRHSGEYMRERAPPNHFSAGMQQPELVRCLICRRVTTRAAAEARRWYCTGGHLGQWQ